MSFKIPLRSDLPFFDLQADLDGVVYTLEFRWNPRNESWHMNVLDETGETILLAGLKLVEGFPLAAQKQGRQPPGWFVLIDTSGQGAYPGLNDLGLRHQLVYMTEAEINP